MDEIICFCCTSEMFLKAMRTAQEYKHEEQMQTNLDLHDKPVIKWFNEKWPIWYRERWIAHLCGKEFWKEFGEQDYNLVCKKEFCFDMDFIARVIDNLKKHRDNISENLGMIFEFSANKDEKELSILISVLRRIDINSHRSPRFDENEIKVLFNAIEEADKHKYIQSEKENRDLGDKSVIEWLTVCWPKINGKDLEDKGK